MSAQVSGPFFGAGAPGGGGRRNNNSGGRGGRGGRGRIHRYYRRDGPRCNFCNARGHVQKDCRRMQSIGMFMDQVNASTTLAAQNIILGRVAQHGYHQQPVNQQQQEWQQWQQWQQQQPQQQLPPPQLLLPAPQEGQQEGEQQQQQQPSTEDALRAQLAQALAEIERLRANENLRLLQAQGTPPPDEKTDS